MSAEQDLLLATLEQGILRGVPGSECRAGDIAQAHTLNQRLYPLHCANFADASPGPVKYALSRVVDWLNDEVRLPLVACSVESRRAVDAALEHAGLG